MKVDETILERIGETFGAAIARLVSSGLVRIGTVEEVEGDSVKVILSDGDDAIRIPLSFLKLDSSLLRIVPKKGSSVAVLFVEGAKNLPYFVAVTEVEEFKLQVGESTIRIGPSLIELNGGENKGLVLVEKLTDRLNKMQREIDKIQTAIQVHTHTCPPGGGITTGTAYSKVALTKVQNSDYENDKIVQ